MKIILSQRRQGGSAVIVVLALVTIVLVFVGANLRSLSTLGRELRLVEQQQMERLKKVQATGAPAPAAAEQTISTP
jgi:hypothetical protein